MLPKSISASSLEVSRECLRKYHALHIERVQSPNNSPAMTGTACHGALENYVQAVYIDKTHTPDWNFLWTCYQKSFADTFQVADFSMTEFEDGLSMLKTWFKRQDLDTISVINVEKKEFFEVPVIHEGVQKKIILNYIIDRLDQTGPDEYRVVDYKTIRVPVNHAELKRKLQARIYALAVRTKFPQAKRIKVEFDLLRHERIGIVLDRQDQVYTWIAVKSLAQRIVDASETDPPETVNTGCRYCPVSATCKSIQKNMSMGTISSLTIEQLAATHQQISNQIKALEDLETKIADNLVKHARELDVSAFEVGPFNVKMSVSSRRNMNLPEVIEVLGKDLIKKYGSITMANIDKIIKNEDITLEQKEKIKGLIYKTYGDPKPTVTFADLE